MTCPLDLTASVMCLKLLNEIKEILVTSITFLRLKCPAPLDKIYGGQVAKLARVPEVGSLGQKLNN